MHMIVQEAYAHYRINQGLQMHQLRVGAVGVLIARGQNVPIDERSVGLACLFHDMGNLLKSDPSTMPELFAPEGSGYWQAVKTEMQEKYGLNEHDATTTMIEELHVPQNAIQLIHGMGFSKARQVHESGSLEQKIVEYADQRVAPFGVVSMAERHREGKERYAKKGKPFFAGTATYDECLVYMKAIEEQIFFSLAITPEYITDISVEPLINELRAWSV